MAHFVIRFAEVGLKGKNRKHFTGLLRNHLRQTLTPYTSFDLHQYHDHFRIHTPDTSNTEHLLSLLEQIPGVSNINHAEYCGLDVEQIQERAVEQMKQALEIQARSKNTFKVKVKRLNKAFPIKSSELERDLGSVIMQAFPDRLEAKMKQPEITVHVEIWEQECIVYSDRRTGVGGLPVDPKQRVISLLSGGIDSPVASWMMMTRGCCPVYVYFHSFPFIGEPSKEKVMDLVKVLTRYQLQSRLYVVSLTQIQKVIKKQAPERFRTILYRRYMNYIVNEIAKKEKAMALVTGDSLGQVASQTLENLICTTDNAELPMLRPLIGIHKDQIIKMAKKIQTFDVSAQDLPDCCTVFQPRFPATRARLKDLLPIEEKLPTAELVQQALEETEVYDYDAKDYLVHS